MEAGPLNKRIILQYPALVPDGMGGFSETYTNAGDPIWAAIWPISAREVITAASSTMGVTHRIRIRYRSAIKPDWRIKFGNRYFSIIAGPFNKNERNEQLEFICREAI